MTAQWVWVIVMNMLGEFRSQCPCTRVQVSAELLFFPTLSVAAVEEWLCQGMAVFAIGVSFPSYSVLEAMLKGLFHLLSP